jgi:hypothetical protein
MAGAHRVDVVLLHQADVLDHPLAGHDLAEIRIPLVAVDAAEEHRLAVHQELAGLGLYRAEADAPGNDLQHLAGRSPSR